LGQLVLMACAYEPEGRFQSPSEMRKNLELLRDGLESEREKKAKGDKRKKTIITISAVIVICLITFVLVFNSYKPTTEGIKKEHVQYGNSHVNIHSGGFFAVDNGFLYKSDEEGLHKENIKTGQKTYLTDLIADKINILDNWIYFTDGAFRFEKYRNVDGVITWEGEPSNIYRMRIDNQNDKPQKILNDYCRFLMVTSEMIVYMTKTDIEEIASKTREDESKLKKWTRYDLWKMNLDGTGKECLVRDIGVYENKIWVDDYWIYYYDRDFVGSGTVKSLKRVGKDGLKTEKILDIQPYSYVICNGWIYYIYSIYYTNSEDPLLRRSYLYKKELNDLKKLPQQVSDISSYKLPGGSTSYMHIHDERIFLIASKGDGNEDRDNIYWLPLDGEVFEPLFADDNIERKLWPYRVSISFINDWIYINMLTGMHRMKTDGSNLEALPREYMCLWFYLMYQYR